MAELKGKRWVGRSYQSETTTCHIVGNTILFHIVGNTILFIGLLTYICLILQGESPHGPYYYYYSYHYSYHTVTMHVVKVLFIIYVHVYLLLPLPRRRWIFCYKKLYT